MMNLLTSTSFPDSLKGGMNRTHAILSLALFSTLPLVAQESPLLQTNFPFQGACIGAPSPAGNVAHKGLAIRLGTNAAVCFDTDLLRMSAGWTGGYISARGVAYDGSHGGFPSIVGAQQFGSKQLPGWADANGSFSDPRKVEPYGPIPETNGRWDGIYVQGSQVLLSYTVLGVKVEEQPSKVEEEGRIGFVRTLSIGASSQPLSLAVCDVEPGELSTRQGRVVISGVSNQIAVAVAPGNADLKLELLEGTRVVLRIAAHAAPLTTKVLVYRDEKGSADRFAAELSAAPQLSQFKTGGSPRWTEAVVTQGVLASSATPDGAYVLDQLTPPNKNPWGRRVRFAGLDFFKDPTKAALCTWDGDVWILTGITADLTQLTWKRFASGGYETLGLKIVDDVIYTSGRDQITRYYDLNQDGEADYYENFNNQVTSSTGFHEFQFDLLTDAEGNFYTAKAGPVNGGGSGFGSGGGNGVITASAGTIQKISKDGKTREIYATGFRAPNGIGVSPTGQVTSGDNEGTWVPQCPIHWVKKGGFHGVETLAHANPIPKFNEPLCWLSKNDTDNSGGGQVWVTSKSWGPFEGELLHMSYGKCRLYLVMKEEIDGQMQGGVVALPVKFTSSAMRAHFNEGDGQLYVCGLQGWQTSAARLTGLDRVRYTGKPVVSVKGLNVTSDGVRLTFTQPLDPQAATDLQNYTLHRWNYRRTSNYGSPEVSVADPQKTVKPSERDLVEVKSAKLSEDGLTVTLTLTDLRPVMQQSIKFSLKTKAGVEFNQEIQHTIHRVPGQKVASGAN